MITYILGLDVTVFEPDIRKPVACLVVHPPVEKAKPLSRYERLVRSEEELLRAYADALRNPFGLSPIMARPDPSDYQIRLALDQIIPKPRHRFYRR